MQFINRTKTFFHIYEVNDYQNIINEILSFFDDELKQTIEYSYEDNEIKTLNKLRQFSIDNEDYKILYIHTKGVCNKNDNIDSWRQYMSFYNITNYKTMIDKLQFFDVCGIDYREYPQKHYSGNFWWSKSEYIKTLDLPINTYSCLTERHKSEFWICSKTDNCYSAFDCGVNVYERHLNNYDKYWK